MREEVGRSAIQTVINEEKKEDILLIGKLPMVSNLFVSDITVNRILRICISDDSEGYRSVG